MTRRRFSEVMLDRFRKASIGLSEHSGISPLCDERRDRPAEAVSRVGDPAAAEEAVMIRTPHLVFLLLLAVILAGSCSSNLQKVDDKNSSYLLALRAEYLASNPDGEFNEYIERGEVVKGMDFLEVLASWGHPAARSKRADATEVWTYREVDQNNKDWIEFTFEFRGSILGDWKIARHYGAGSLDMPPRGEVLIRGEYSGGKRVP